MSNTPPTSKERVWTLYTERRPETVGPYLWQVQSIRVKGLVVQFVAWMRERGAGYRQVISPSFDYWNGAEVLVPAGTKWATTEVVCKEHQSVGLTLPQVELLPCPFCRVVPFWHGVESPSGGGVIVGSAPHEYNSWWLECCSWAKTPHRPDPRDIAEQRNRMIRGAA
jgi:hypothetical protein